MSFHGWLTQHEVDASIRVDFRGYIRKGYELNPKSNSIISVIEMAVDPGRFRITAERSVSTPREMV